MPTPNHNKIKKLVREVNDTAYNFTSYVYRDNGLLSIQFLIYYITFEQLKILSKTFKTTDIQVFPYLTNDTMVVIRNAYAP